MKSETLIQQPHPPTPPSINELQYGLHHIALHNAGHDAEHQFQFDGSHIANGHGSAYGSPAPMSHEVLSSHSSQQYQTQQGGGSQFPDSHGLDFGLGVSYNSYGEGSNFHHQEDQYNGLTNSQSMFSGSPPTPSSAIESEKVRRTRSGRTIVPNSSSKTPKPRPKVIPKSRKPKNDKPKTPKLTAPLSVLTKDYHNVPVRNMEEWVNRSAEVRRKEVEKRNGYVTRPMNSFMLYRSAYAERTKQWCLQNNHQVVSSVSGESWPLEPPQIREMYNEYARIERINHQNAHPTYKFSPSKAAPPPKRRKGEFTDDDEPSDLDDAEWDPPVGRRPKSKATKRHDRGVEYPANAMNNEFYARSFGSSSAMSGSSWDTTNEGEPMALPISQNDIYYQYFQQAMQPNFSMGGVEELKLRKVDTPGLSMQFSQVHPLLGLPGGNGTDMMQHLHSHSDTPFADEHQVDPMLLAFDGGHHNGGDPTMSVHLDFHNVMERELDQASVNSLLGVHPSHDEYSSEHWHSDPTMASMEHPSEFDKWMDDHHVA
ncbi:hypothetical protein GQ43DRAFT_434057 [Delitschia confertaspora ATCC 74209]|uniref:HMG box domain-containing protein n=1 Tax=Delitschia confertaspora ATCC 74209 TaxID=1513339 RepID=A0A9P4MW78_9PLEO|nr:hypothetical protein GQ43DRAFT_434057 [Delitschia confertaspora ATCC 74209]